MSRRRLILAISACLLLNSCLSAQDTPTTRRSAEQQLLRRFDKDGDGRLGPEERAEARRALADRRAGRPSAAGPAVPGGVRALRDVEYAKVDGKPLALDIYLPKAPAKPLPVIVWIHGGGWRAGSKEHCPAVPQSARGYAVVSINYRLTDVAPFPAQIYDCKGAIRWLRAHAKEYNIDPDRIGVWGSSAGGHLVALLGTSGGVKEVEGDVGGNRGYSSRVQAVCDFCGPASFREQDFANDPRAKSKAGNEAVTKLFGGPLVENRDKARMASPVEYASKDDPPFLIVHGGSDPLVNPKHSELLTAALKKAGVDVTLHIVPKAGHGVGSPETNKLAAEFFDRHLKGATGESASTHPPSTSTRTGPSGPSP